MCERIMAARGNDVKSCEQVLDDDVNKANKKKSNSTRSDHVLVKWSHVQARMPLRRRRRRVLPTVRLGGGGRRRRLGWIRIFRRIKLRWLKMKLKRLKEYYKGLVKDVIQGSDSLEAFQQRLLLETSFAIPVMGLSFTATRPP